MTINAVVSVNETEFTDSFSIAAQMEAVYSGERKLKSVYYILKYGEDTYKVIDSIFIVNKDTNMVTATAILPPFEHKGI
jgi:hypothetical protein